MAWWNPFDNNAKKGWTVNPIKNNPQTQLKDYADNPDKYDTISSGGNTTKNIDTFEDPTTGLTPAESAPAELAPAEPAGPSEVDQYNTLSDAYDLQSDELFGNAMDTFDKMGANVDKNLQLQLDAAGDKRAQAQRRGIESGALQGSSGFGGMQAGKDLQAGMYGDQLANQAYQNALELKLGIDKGRIGAFLERANSKQQYAQDMGARAIDQEAKDRWHADELEQQGLVLQANVLSNILSNPDAMTGIDEEELRNLMDEVLNS